MANHPVAPLPRDEIGRRLLVTAGVLLAYRLGTWVPIPGVDAAAAPWVAAKLKHELLSVFGLGLTPFLSVLFVFEFIKLIVPPLSRWEASDPRHTQTLTRVVYLLALVCAGFQARGVTGALQDAGMLIDGPGWAIVVPLTLVAGTALLCWLGEIITRHGLGNGFWVLVITPTLAGLAAKTAGTLELIREGAVRSDALFAELAFFGVATVLIAMTGRAAGASAENRVSGADFIGIWPPLLAVYITGYKITIGGAEINVAAELLLLAALIAVFNGLQWLGSAQARQRPVWAVAAVQIFICVGAVLLTRALRLPPLDGAWLILVVTTIMSCVRAAGLLPEDPRTRPAI